MLVKDGPAGSPDGWAICFMGHLVGLVATAWVYRGRSPGAVQVVDELNGW